MKLPRMSGSEVFFELRRQQPGIEVLMMSGHSVTDLLAQAVDGGAHRIFYPPYGIDSLLRSLLEIDGNALVLVVDNNPDLAQKITQALAGEGRTVRVAGDFDAAQKLAANEGDLLLLERQPTVIRGLEVYWQLRKLGRDVPTVITTPGPADGYVTIERLNHFPVCGYFIKPFDPFELLPALESLAK